MSLHVVTYRSVASIEKELHRLAERGDLPVAFIVPGSDDREWLKDILVDRSTMGFEPFRIWRWDDLYREMCAAVGCSCLIQIDPPDHWLALSALTEQVVEREGERLPLGVKQPGFVHTLGVTVRELIREEVPPEALTERRDGEDAHELDEPVELLAHLYRGYVDLLAKRGLMDSAGISTEITALLRDYPQAAEWLCSRQIVLVGFYSFTHSQLAMVRAMVGCGAEVVLFSPEAGMEQEYGAPAQLEGAVVHRCTSRAPAAFSVVGGDSRYELETVVRNLVLWSEGMGPLVDLGIAPGWEQLGMVVQERSLGLAVEVLNRYSVPFHRAQGRSVAETALWGTVRRIWECYRDGWQPRPTAALLCLPWIVPEGDEHAFVVASPRGIKAWRRFLENEPETLSALEAMNSFAEGISRGGTARELLESLEQLVNRDLRWQETLSRQIADRPDLDMIVLEMGSAIRELERKLVRIVQLQVDLGEAGARKLQDSEAMAFLAAWAESAVVWPEPKRCGVMTLYGGTPPVLAHHPVWVFCEVTAHAWPGSIVESPLLGDQEKERLHEADLRGSRLDHTHLPLLSERRSQREVLFRRLVTCGDETVIVSRPSVDGSGRPLAESSFLPRALQDGWIVDKGAQNRPAGQVLPRWSEPAVSPAEIHEPPAGLSRYRPGRVFPEGAFRSAVQSIRLSSLDDFGACPFRFLCAHIWRLREPDTPGYNSLLAGTAIHRLWEELWTDYVADPHGGLSRRVSKLWEPVFERCYRSLLKSPDLARRRDALLENVIETVRFVESLEDAGLRERRVASFCEMPLPDLVIDGVRCTGAADRVDLLDDGSLLLWDYKLGSATGYRRAMQLAAYGVSLERGRDELSFSFSRVGGYVFVGHRDQTVVGAALGDLKPLMGLSPGSRVDLVERMTKAHEMMTAAAQAINTGMFLPKYDNHQVCLGCPYTGLCRKSELHGHLEEDDEHDRS